MIFEIWDLKNTISRAETFEKGDFSKNDYSRAENNSNQVFFKKKLGSKNQVSNLILPWESNKSEDFFIQYFQNSHFKMWIWHSKIPYREFPIGIYFENRLHRMNSISDCSKASFPRIRTMSKPRAQRSPHRLQGYGRCHPLGQPWPHEVRDP